MFTQGFCTVLLDELDLVPCTNALFVPMTGYPNLLPGVFLLAEFYSFCLCPEEVPCKGLLIYWLLWWIT